MRVHVLLFGAFVFGTTNQSTAMRYVPPQKITDTSCSGIIDRETLIAHLVRAEEKPDVANRRAAEYLKDKTISEVRRDICEK